MERKRLSVQLRLQHTLPSAGMQVHATWVRPPWRTLFWMPLNEDARVSYVQYWVTATPLFNMGSQDLR